jgi:hypothetical protein
MFSAVCPAGYGTTTTSSGACEPCPTGTYCSDSRQPGDTTCTACPASAVTYKFYYDNNVSVYSPQTVTEPGASSAGQCLAEFSQLEKYNWQLAVADHVVHRYAETLDACVAACRGRSDCAFISFDSSATSPDMCTLRVTSSTTAK